MSQSSSPNKEIFCKRRKSSRRHWNKPSIFIGSSQLKTHAEEFPTNIKTYSSCLPFMIEHLFRQTFIWGWRLRGKVSCHSLKKIESLGRWESRCVDGATRYKFLCSCHTKHHQNRFSCQRRHIIEPQKNINRFMKNSFLCWSFFCYQLTQILYAKSIFIKKTVQRVNGWCSNCG